jgi:hypothetical protein
MTGRVKRLLVLLGLLAGCAIGRGAVNEPLESAPIDKLVPGQTTALETVELLGAPVDVVQLGRRSAYFYKHTRETTTGVVLVLFNMLNQDERQDRIWVFFDEEGTLTHFGSTFEADRTRVATPFADIYKEDPPEEPAESGE